MVHILLRPNHPILAQALQGSRLPHLQLLARYQVPPRRTATDAGRRGTTGGHDARWERSRCATERRAAV